MKSNRGASGFTLIEMVVVLAVVAILAAILTPTIAKNLNDAKIARANNEVQVIAGAIGSFYKDTGRWPTADGTDATLPDSIRLLYGDGDTPASTAAGANWLVSGAWSANIDTFAHQLITNLPGTGENVYVTTATKELRWRGPYITEVKRDPWGCYYACNIWYTFNTTTNMVGVWSAGPNRTADTSPSQASSTAAVAVDDILYRIQ